MNDPPTAVGGIRIHSFRGCSRLGMNNPPTAVGGIRIHSFRDCSRLGMNNPPTAVGGIRGLAQESSRSEAFAIFVRRDKRLHHLRIYIVSIERVHFG